MFIVSLGLDLFFEFYRLGKLELAGALTGLAPVGHIVSHWQRICWMVFAS